MSKTTSIAVLTCVAIVLTACGDAGEPEALPPEAGADIDQLVAECLAEAGYEQEVLADAVARQRADPQFARDVEACAQRYLPSAALEELGGDGLATNARVEALNDQLLAALQCVRDDGWDVNTALQRGDAGFLMLDPVLRQIPDGQLMDFFQALEECGGPPAPPLRDGATVVSPEECVRHSHDGEPEHAHGDC